MSIRKTYIKAFDAKSQDANCTINYELHSLNENQNAYEYINKVFIRFNSNIVYVDLKNFKLLNYQHEFKQNIKNKNISASVFEYDGYSEIIFSGHVNESKIEVTFSERDRSFRIIQNTFDLNSSTGSMIHKNNIRIPQIDFIQGETKNERN